MQLQRITVTLPSSKDELEQQIKRAKGYDPKTMEGLIRPTVDAFSDGFLLGMTITVVDLAATLSEALDDYRRRTGSQATLQMATALVRAFIGSFLGSSVETAIAKAALDS